MPILRSARLEICWVCRKAPYLDGTSIDRKRCRRVETDEWQRNRIPPDLSRCFSIRADSSTMSTRVGSRAVTGTSLKGMTRASRHKRRAFVLDYKVWRQRCEFGESQPDLFMSR